ncbi:oxytocin receptor [Rhipicephalus microplus]|uniref:oxytocin receptor n=1 Tax=Rhipicephalus microplus TaxID=6941 RepID=UPI00188833FC|nr:oxytocin receptor-like [Rhipicephalus microplus]
MDLVASQEAPFTTPPVYTIDSTVAPVNATTWAGSRDESLAQVELGVLALIFTFTVAGNGCVLAALAARRSKMTRMYYFLLHLCVSDLTTAFLTVLPQLGWDATYRFRGGNVACKLVKFGQLLGPYLSSYVLVVTAIDRYQAICFPLSNCSWTPNKSKLLISVAWIVSLMCCGPQLFIFSYQEISPGVHDCWGTYVEPWGLRAYVTWYGVTVFFVPLLVLTFTYVRICRAIWRNLYLKRCNSEAEATCMAGRAYRFKGASTSRAASFARSTNQKPASFMGPRSHSVRGLSRAKIKTVKITVVVILLYIACSSPFICVQMWMHWSHEINIGNSWTNAIVTILMLLNSLNSCVNPWIYLLFNRNLMNALRHQVCRCPAKNVSAGLAVSGIVPEVTTQGTEANVTIIQQPSLQLLADFDFPGGLRGQRACCRPRMHTEKNGVSLAEAIAMAPFTLQATSSSNGIGGGQYVPCQRT